MSDCGCPQCESRVEYGLPVLEIRSATEESRLAYDLAIAVFEDFHFLQKIWRTFEDTLTSRWTELSVSERQELLKTILPDIPIEHRPDFHSLRESYKAGKFLNDVKKHELDTPQLNLTDLCHKEALLVWVKSRSKFFPGEFAQMDGERANIKPSTHFAGFDWEARMVFYGKNHAFNYGVLQSEEELGEDRFHTAMEPPVGLYVLEIQQRIMDFLAGCCRQLLHDKDLTSWPDKDGGRWLPPEAHDLMWPSLRALEVQSAYGGPSEVGLSELAMLISSKVTEYEDFIWSLMTDPEIFLRSIRDFGEHIKQVNEHMLGLAKWIVGSTEDEVPVVLQKHAAPAIGGLAKSKKEAARETLATRMFWARAAMNCLAEAHTELMYWKATEAQLYHLKALYGQHEAYDRQSMLPDEVEEAFASFEQHVMATLNVPLGFLEYGIPASQEMQHLYGEPDDPTTPGENRKLQYLEVKENMRRAELRVHSTFLELCDNKPSIYALQSVTDEIQHLLEMDEAASALISPWIARRLANVGLNARILTQITSIQPWANSWQVTGWPDVQEQINELESVGHIIKNTAFACSVKNTVNPLVSSSQYPSDQKRNKTNLTKMINFENMQWDFFDQFYSRLAEEMDGHPFMETIAELISRWEFPERTKLPESHQPKPSAGSSSATIVGQDVVGFNQQATSQQSEGMPQSARAYIMTTREKRKTRPADSAQDNQQDVAAPEPEPQPQPAKLPLDDRSWDVFDTLFNMSPGTKPGTLVFAEFKYAMDYIGFDAIEIAKPRYSFEPRKDEKGSRWTRSFPEHAPHGKETNHWERFQYLAVRRHLTRALGLTAESFVKEE